MTGFDPAAVQGSGSRVSHTVERSERVSVVPAHERFVIGAFAQRMREDIGYRGRSIRNGRRRRSDYEAVVIEQQVTDPSDPWAQSAVGN